jgi:hypothetical protein
MRFNIFRNPLIDVQVSMLMDTFDDAVRKQTEDYWRNKIAREILEYFPNLDNVQMVTEKIKNGPK